MPMKNWGAIADMVDPADTLVVMIEAAAALAGFAGIVATLRREKWTELDSLQIKNLLSCAFSALFVSILALVLIHAKIDENTIWISLSAVWLLAGSFATLRNALDYRKLSKSTGAPFPSLNNIFWFTTVIGVLVLQVYNIVVLAAFWPVLIGLTWLFGLTCFSFWQLLIRHK